MKDPSESGDLDDTQLEKVKEVLKLWDQCVAETGLSGRRLFNLLVKNGTVTTSVLLAVMNGYSLFYGAARATDPFSFRTRQQQPVEAQVSLSPVQDSYHHRHDAR